MTMVQHDAQALAAALTGNTTLTGPSPVTLRRK